MESASRIIPTGKKPCLTGTLKKRVSTITNCKLLMSGYFSESEKNPVSMITKCKSPMSGYFSQSEKNPNLFIFCHRAAHMMY